jgi:hypothetical protein
MGAAARHKKVSRLQCPQCQTSFDVGTDFFDKPCRLAACCTCGSLFDPQDNMLIDPLELEPARLSMALRLKPEQAQRRSHADLPFKVPDNLEPLQPSADAGLDMQTMLEDPPRRGFWLSILVSAVLLAALLLQFAWQHRFKLLESYPPLERICEYVECRPKVVRQPQSFSVLQREIRAADNAPGWLTLRLAFRNNADTAQHYPDIHLSLLDNSGNVLIRRRLAPSDYHFPPPADDAVIAPGEVTTFSLDFEDPGYQATGFMVDFL